MHDLEKAIRERAYHLWLEGGCQHGHADAHWLRAKREIVSASFENAGVSGSEQPFASKSKSTRKLAAKKKRSAA
jgi:DUF2934 family protein